MSQIDTGAIIHGARAPLRRALVTGASSGIGAAFATLLARDGSDLVIVARRRDRLEALAEELRAEYGVGVEVLVADLAERENLRTIERLLANERELDLLVNNAGFAAYMPFTQLDPDLAETQIRLQVVAPVRLTRAALPGMISRGRGAIINAASTLGFAGPPERATYSATKAFLITFTERLSAELGGTGVQVQVLCPALTRTEFHGLWHVDMSRVPPDRFMSSEAVVDASLAGLRLGEVVCIPGLPDPADLEESRTARQRIFERSLTGVVAGRYREPSSEKL